MRKDILFKSVTLLFILNFASHFLDSLPYFTVICDVYTEFETDLHNLRKKHQFEKYVTSS